MPTPDQLDAWTQRCWAKAWVTYYTRMRRQAWARYGPDAPRVIAALDTLIAQHEALTSYYTDLITDGERRGERVLTLDQTKTFGEGTCAKAGAGAADTLTVTP